MTGEYVASMAEVQRLLSSICPDVSAVVVWKLDRLSRSLRDTLSMIEDIFTPAGVRLVSVTESIDTSTPAGRMMLNLLAPFAQLERGQGIYTKCDKVHLHVFCILCDILFPPAIYIRL